MKSPLEIVKELPSYWAKSREVGLRITMLWTAADVVRILTGAPMRSVSQITPQLHLGGQYRRRGWPRLAARGVTAVVDLRAESSDKDDGIAPVRYLHLPTDDDEAPTLDQLQKGVAFIAAEIAQGGTVYVHCHSGIGRAATLVASYLVTTGLTPDESWTLIRKTRAFICPESVQVEQVKRFASLQARSEQTTPLPVVDKSASNLRKKVLWT